MASVLTVKAFLEKVSTQLSDTNPQFQRWKQHELVGWLNDSYLAIAKFMPWTFARTDAIKLKTGTRQQIAQIAASDVFLDGSSNPGTKPLRGILLQGLEMNMGEDGQTPGRAITLVDKDVLDRSFPLWHTPRYHDDEVLEYTYDPRTPKQFFVNPGVRADSTVWVMASIVAEPDMHDTSTDFSTGANALVSISVQDTYVDEALNYVLARAYLKDAETEGSANLVATHSKLFSDSINALVKTRTGVNPNLKSLPLNPATEATAS